MSKYTSPFRIQINKDKGDSDEQFDEAVDKLLECARTLGIAIAAGMQK